MKFLDYWGRMAAVKRHYFKCFRINLNAHPAIYSIRPRWGSFFKMMRFERN